jgi:hypothetical protein
MLFMIPGMRGDCTGSSIRARAEKVVRDEKVAKLDL